MLCVPRANCDFKGSITQQTLNLSPQLEMLRVPLIPCVNPDTQAVEVCCRDPNYVDPWPQNMKMNGQMNGQPMAQPAPAPAPAPQPAPAPAPQQQPLTDNNGLSGISPRFQQQQQQQQPTRRKNGYGK